MATVTGSVTVNLGLQMRVTSGVLAPVTYPVPINLNTNYSTSGTAAGQLDKIYGATVNLVASTPVTLDLTNLTGPDGSTMNLARVREFAVSVVTVTSAFNVTVYRGASNGWLFLPDSTHPLTVPANGAEIVIRDPNSSGAGIGYVVGGSSKTITIDPGANAVTIAILIAGDIGRMNPDLLAAVIAYLRTLPAIVSAFGDAPTSIKFWADYAGPSLPAMPYLVLTEPSDRLTFETKNDSDDIGPMADGIVSAEVYAASKTQARALGEQIVDALTDPDLSIEGQAVIYFRPTGHAFPILTQSGTDGQPTIFARIVQFRFMTEPTE